MQEHTEFLAIISASSTDHRNTKRQNRYKELNINI